MAIVGVIDQDDYGVTFERDDGSQVYLTGDAAKQHAAGFGAPANDAAPMQELPEEEPIQATLYNDIPEQAQQLTDIHPMAMAQAAPATSSNVATDAAAVAAESALQTDEEKVKAGLDAYAAGSGSGGMKHIRPDGSVGDPSQPGGGGAPTGPPQYKYVGGSPGNDAYAVQRGAKHVQVPTARTVVSEGADPMDPRALAARAQLINERGALDDRRLDASIEGFKAAKAEAQTKRLHAFLEQERLEDLHKEREAQAQKARDRVLNVDQEIKEFNIDPNRLFKEKGAWAAVAATIGQALGAYAAILGGGENYAQKIIDGAINRDMRAQEAEYRKLGATRGNLIWEYEQELGDVEQAKLQAKAAKLAAAEAYAEELAAVRGTADAQRAKEDLVLKLREKRIELGEEALRRARGKVKVTESSAMQLPKRPTGPARVRTTDKDKAKWWANQASIAKNKRIVQGDGEDADKDLQTYEGKIRPVVAARSAISNVRKNFAALEKKYSNSAFGVPGINTGGLGTAYQDRDLAKTGEALGFERSKDANTLNQDIDDVVNAATAALEGVATDKDVERIAKAMRGSGSLRELNRHLKKVEKLLTQKKVSIDAAHLRASKRYDSKYKKAAAAEKARLDKEPKP